ncbi:glutamyl-tRNA reductase [Natrialbaceae archaeon A-gly3]
MIDAGVVTCGRVTHDSASVDDLAVASPESQRIGVAELLSRPEVEEALVLSTCNRVEAYVVTPERAVGEVVLEDFFADVATDAVVVDGHDESLRHLLAVAAGLESVVLGEDQIIGQVRDAYEDARTAGAIGQMLETAVTKAIHVGERARTETEINEGVVSLGSAAAKLVAETVGVEESTALVVGAGEMGELAAKSLADHGAEEVIVANRTLSTAREIFENLEVSGEVVSLEALEDVTARSDVVVAATGSEEPLLGPEELGDRRQAVVDLGQPRDVDPTVDDVADVILYDLDDLEAVTRRTRTQRAEAAAEVEEMVDREYELLCEQYKRTRADEVIAAMYESAERVKSRELETALSRLEANGDVTDEQAEIVRSMADALVNQMLAPPTKSLREAAADDDWETINTALHLFDPDFGPEPPAAIAEAFGGEDAVGALEDD